MSTAERIEPSFRSVESFTQDEFRAWLERRDGRDLGKQELLRGRIVMSPPAGRVHGRLEVRLGARIVTHVEALGMGETYGPSTGYELPSGDTLQPDVSFLSHARSAAGRARQGAATFVRVVPELVVEVLSPSTARRDRTDKLEIYAANGVDEYWLVDPAARAVSVFHLAATGGYGAAEVVSRGPVPSRVLPGLGLDGEQIFAGIDP